jgi:O-succinylbenzoic acid--CoA ligase
VTLSIFDAARATPERLALVSGELELSFAELASRVERRLGELREAGALDASGERPVAVVARLTLETVETLLALFAAGTPALVIHARSSELERAQLVQRTGAVYPPSAGARDLRTLSAATGGPRFDPERIAALVPTSGSTGEPRLVRLSHRAFLAAAHLMAQHYGVEDDRWLLALPLAHIAGLGMLVRCVVNRSALVLFEPKRSLLAELDALAAAVARHSITLISLVPTLLARLVEPPHAWQPPASLRAVVLGGAPIPRDLVLRARRRGIPVVPTYGMTEVCASAVSGRYDERLLLRDGDSELLPSGFPLEGVELRFVDGVIELRGPTLFSGYHGDPASDPRSDWLRTHDRGHLDARGELTVQGRTSDVIITAGENVDPAEVEAALLAVPGVRAACVIGTPDPTFGELVTALLATTPEGPPSKYLLTEQLAGRLASHKLPRRFCLVRELPLSPAGKIDRRGAKKLYVEHLGAAVDDAGTANNGWLIKIL